MSLDATPNLPPTVATATVVQKNPAPPTKVLWDADNPTRLILMSDRAAQVKVYETELARVLADRLTVSYPTISTHKGVLGGKPHIKGTRLAVASVISAICVHGSIEAAVADYSSRYTKEEFEDALRFARDFLTDSLT